MGKTTPEPHSPTVKNHVAIRYLFYWSAGISVMLLVTSAIKGTSSEVTIPLYLAGGVALLSGIAYWQRTTAAERRMDYSRKISDPTYE